jgi:hypothetical protein
MIHRPSGLFLFECLPKAERQYVNKHFKMGWKPAYDWQYRRWNSLPESAETSAGHAFPIEKSGFMTERYYLLRNNRETGPYLLDELLQQCLLPHDLLWVEGRSENWSAPYEISEVQKALPKGYSFSPDSPDKNIPAHPSDREQALRAESLRRRALAALYQQQVPMYQSAPRAEMGAPAYYGSEEDAVVLVQHKPARSRAVAGEVFLFCIFGAFAVLGWRSGFFAHMVQVKSPEATVASRLVTESSHAAQSVNQPVTASSVNTALQTPAVADSSFLQDSIARVAALPKKPWKPAVASVTNSPETTAVQTAIVPKEIVPAANTSVTRKEADTAAETAAHKPVMKEPVKEPQHGQTTAATTSEPALKEPAEKHKSLGQVLRGIFKKKKKDDDAATAQAAAPGR